MAVPVRCPNPKCGVTADVAEDLLGRAIRCKHCGHRFTLSATRPAAGPRTPALDPLARETVYPPQATGPVPLSAPAGADDVPRQIGRFLIRGRVGAGAFGAVYRAHDPQLDREVALKVPRPGTLDSSQALERFLREGRAAARLRHPHIVPVYEAGTDGVYPYLATAFIDGCTLDRALSTGTLGCRRAAEIVRDLAEALEYAHRQGVVHRDVKPANVLLDREQGAQLADFGLAYHQDAAGRLTQEGALLGTPAYMAPEQADGQAGAARPASDQYSLGVVLYELLCGRTPFSGPPTVLLYNAIHLRPPSPRTIDPSVPPELEAICLRAMAKRPEERYARCQDLADELQRWLAREPAPRPREVRRREWPPAVLITAAAALAVALVTGVLAVVLVARGPKSPAPEARRETALEDHSPAEAVPVAQGPEQTPEPRPAAPPDRPAVPAKTPEPAPAPPPPAKDAPGVGRVTLVEGLPSLLLRRSSERPPWQALPPGVGTVGPNDTLLVLPGYRSALHLDSGVNLLLWGNVTELLDIPLLESAITLQPAKDADLELTLDRGRVLLSNQKASGPVKVRVHFHEDKPRPAETWELTLDDPGTEVALDLLGRYPRGVGFDLKGGPGPRAELYLVVLAGTARVKADGSTYTLHAPPGACLMTWDNYGDGVHPPGQINPDMLRIWDKAVPQSESAGRATAALNELLKRWFAKPAEVIVEESLFSDQPPSRVLGVLCLGALDAVPKVLDVLADEGDHSELREAAVLTLRQWIARRADHDRKLYEILKDEKGYTPPQAETVLQLLHDFADEQLGQPQMWQTLIGYLRADKSAIRSLAYWHLYRLVPQGRDPKFNPVGDIKQREAAFQAWKTLIPDGNLPRKPGPTNEGVPGKPPGIGAVQKQPPVADILSGRALNELLTELTGLHARKLRGPRIDLEEDSTLRRINVCPIDGAGNVGVLKPVEKGAALDWPLGLRGADYRDAVRRLNQKTSDAVKWVRDNGQVNPATLIDIKEDVDGLRRKLSSPFNDLPTSQTIEAKRFLNQLDEGVAVLRQPNAARYFDGTYAARGKTVADLVDHMSSKGLKFVPAVAEEEAAYRALYAALAAYRDAMPAQKGKD